MLMSIMSMCMEAIFPAHSRCVSTHLRRYIHIYSKIKHKPEMYLMLCILVCAPELGVFRLYTLRLFIRMVHCILTHRRRNIFTSMRSTSSMHTKYILCTYFSIYIHIYIYIYHVFTSMHIEYAQQSWMYFDSTPFKYAW